MQNYFLEAGRENFDNLAYKKFLQRYSLYGRGFWIRELYCMMSDPLPLFGKFYKSCELHLFEMGLLKFLACNLSPKVKCWF